jgi:hypothetical protein
MLPSSDLGDPDLGFPPGEAIAERCCLLRLYHRQGNDTKRRRHRLSWKKARLNFHQWSRRPKLSIKRVGCQLASWPIATTTTQARTTRQPRPPHLHPLLCCSIGHPNPIVRQANLYQEAATVHGITFDEAPNRPSLVAILVPKKKEKISSAASHRVGNPCRRHGRGPCRLRLTATTNIGGR